MCCCDENASDTIDTWQCSLIWLECLNWNLKNLILLWILGIFYHTDVRIFSSTKRRCVDDACMLLKTSAIFSKVDSLFSNLAANCCSQNYTLFNASNFVTLTSFKVSNNSEAYTIFQNGNIRRYLFDVRRYGSRMLVGWMFGIEKIPTKNP